MENTVEASEVINDIKFPCENLIKEIGPWLSSRDDTFTTLKAEFQLEKALVIDYIDIGNLNTALLSIEVGRSTWAPLTAFETLLPTVALMTANDWRTEKNAKTVRMFNKADFSENVGLQKWDRIRLTCSNPFRKNKQFGLTFIHLFAAEELNSSFKSNQIFSPPQEKWMSPNTSSPSYSKSDCKKMCRSLCYLEESRINSDDEKKVLKEIPSPVSRAAQLLMASKPIPRSEPNEEKKKLELEALDFLISLNLNVDDINNLKVSHVREQFEFKRNKVLTTREKLIFKNISLDFASERIRKYIDFDSDTSKREFLGRDSPEPPSKRQRSFPAVEINSPNTSKAPPIPQNSPNTSKAYSNCFEELDDIKEAILHPSPSDKRLKLRNEVDITNQTHSWIKRNSFALEDSIVTPMSKPKARKSSKSCAKIRNSPQESNLGVWRTPKGAKQPTKDEFKEFRISSGSNLEKSPVGYSNSLKSTKLELDFYPEKSSASPIDFLECPLCTDIFPAISIEEHASQCLGSSENNEDYNRMVSMEECPVCSSLYSKNDFQTHVQECVERHFN